MVDAMLELMLGPLRGVTEFYMEHQLILGSLIVGGAIIKIYFSNSEKEEESEFRQSRTEE